MIKDWGSDCVFFFNYSRINAGISNERVFVHMEALFGEENFKALRSLIVQPNVSRERAIMDHLTLAMKDAGARYVLPFRFRNEAGTRTTHYLVFVTKHPTGYEIMKEIMGSESSQADQGVPSFEYSPALENAGMLFETALDELEDNLTAVFAGRSIAMIDVYHEHNLGTPYIKKSYKTALGNLERANRISTDRPNRPKGTFADGVRASFPQNPRPRT